MQIRHRIYLSLLLLALLPLLVVTWINEKIAEQVMTEVIASDFQLLSRDKADSIGRQLDEYIAHTRLLANQPFVVDALEKANAAYRDSSEAELLATINRNDEAWINARGATALSEQIASSDLSQQLLDIKNKNPKVYGELFVTDRYGATVAMTSTLSDYYQADEYWWQAATSVEEGVFLDDRGFDISADTIVIGVVVPIRRAGQLLGVLKINFRVRTILDIVSGEGLRTGHVLHLVRSDGTVISSSASLPQGSTIAPSIMQAISSNDSSVWEGVHDGKGVLMAHYPMKHSFSTRVTAGAVTGVSGERTLVKRWYVIYEVEREVIFSALAEMRERVKWLALIALVLAALVGFLLSRAFTRPLQKLKQGAQIIATGHLEHRLVLDGRNELADLAQAFNAMTAELQKTMASRDELNREIEERKRSESALQRSEEKYRQLLNNIPQRIFYKDVDGRYLAVNPSFAQVFGRKPEEIVGKNDYDFFPQEYAKKYRDDDQAVIDSGEVKEFDEEYVHEGELHYVHTVKAPVYDEKGQARGMLGIFWDVTEQRRAEQEIKLAREYLRNVINSMPTMLIGLDGELRISHWNSAAAQGFSRDETDVLGKTLEQARLLPTQLTMQIVNAVKEGESLQLHNQSAVLGENERRLDIITYPLHLGQEEGGAVLLISDVTERVRVETMMVQTEKMMSVGGLAAGMAHELNNPLGGILQSLQNLRRRLSPDLEKNLVAADKYGIDLKQLQHYLEERNITTLLEGVTKAGKRASDIIANMMNFSRTLTESVSQVDLSLLIDSVIELASLDYDLKKKYAFRDIRIIKEYDPQMPYVPCLEKDIKQVILNLLRNAAQALAEGVNTSPPTITLRTRSEGGMALIEIEDNGPGIESELQGHIFEPFFTTREVGEGSGLGLSVAYFIVHDRHHGQLELDSVPGRGARFTIRLPLKAISL